MKVIALEYVERLEHDRTLRPETGLVDFISAISCPGWSVDLGVKSRHVRGSEQASIGFRKCRDAAGDGAFVEIVASSHKPCVARWDAINARGYKLLSLDDFAKGAGEVGLPENLSWPGYFAPGQIDPGCRRPSLKNL